MTDDLDIFEDPRFQYDGSIPTFCVTNHIAFNTNAIVYDNTPWRPGREIDVEQRSAEDERKIKNLATRVMSNGVEVLVRDKSTEGKQEQRKLKLIHLSAPKPSNKGINSAPSYKSLLSSAVATVVNRQEISAFFPLHQFMQHNYIIKTCMTTYTYLTTVVQNKRSAVSTFETIVSVVTTESLTNLYATDVLADIKPTKTKYMEVKTIQPSAANMYLNNIPKLDKRIDHQEEHNFDLIQPSEINHAPCTTSCTCSHTKTESLKTKYSNAKQSVSTSDKYHTKSTKYSGTKMDVRPTHKEILNKTQYRPYDYETSSQTAPTDKIVEKFTQVTDYLDDKDTNSVEPSDLLTNEQAPPPSKINKVSSNKTSEIKPERPQKVNKNKFVMAELIKLGSLGIKGLSQLAPVIEKMTGGFMKRQDSNKTTTTTTTTTTTVKPVTKVTSYNANKRVDSDESKYGTFPIYIPVDDMETSESQVAFTNATLHQNFAWAAEHKHTKGHFVKSKIVHESPLVNGGIPISPGEIITANSDVIVGKPAVGGPLTLAASGIKLQNPVHPPPIDNIVANNEQYITKEKLPVRQTIIATNIDDSFDLRPPDLPKFKSKPNKSSPRPQEIYFGHQNSHMPSSRLTVSLHTNNDPVKYLGPKKHSGPILVNHGRPTFLDFVPNIAKPVENSPIDHAVTNYKLNIANKENDIPDNNPSSSEIVSTKIITDDKYQNIDSIDSLNKPFLVDIQPSKVANVLIPHGSSTALVFAGSTEPHKTGDYVDDPLPYPEPGYFGSFSIDAPHMTNVHNVVPNKNLFLVKPSVQPGADALNYNTQTFKEKQLNNEHKLKWNENKRPKDLNNLPVPTSNQESYIQIGPKITAYNPKQYNTDFDKYQQSTINEKPKEEKEKIDKEYENYLAVPPPPLKMNINQDNRYDNRQGYNHQTPVTHTKPIQDSKVFLNVQHPVSNQLPPKVTSEIYFASQLLNTHPTPTYTFKIPQSAPANSNLYLKYPQNNYQSHKSGSSNHVSNSYIVSASNTADKSSNNNKVKENIYTVTLNTATNVGSTSNSDHVLGSSITVPITTTSDNGQINANIPIGTNFAIRVEDDPAKYESVALHGKRHPLLTYDKQGHIPFNNFDNIHVDSSSSTLNSNKEISNTQRILKDKHTQNEIYPLVPPSVNSHANFPMINEDINLHTNSKPVITYEDSKNLVKQDKIPQSNQNISTNSHGWYSSILSEGNVKNINVELTTRKNIPLNYDVNNQNLPEFGEKIASVGKPPAEFWHQNNKQSIYNLGVGKPFSKSKVDTTSNVSAFTVKPNYIPSIYGIRQPAYDIPMRDNSDETTTSKALHQKPIKTVYETAEEVYDGEEEMDLSGEIDGEVSSESMRIPYVSSSNERKNTTKMSSAVILTQNIVQPKTDHNNKSVQLMKFNPGTQTEKPFSSYNKTSFHSNSIKPVYNHVNIFTKPRPFTINTAIPLDNQLQQPHWQINQLMENVTNNMSYEDNFELNIGEEVNTGSTSKPITTNHSIHPEKIGRLNSTDSKHKDSVLLNRTRIVNESNIITSVVHITDKKPLTVQLEEKVTLPTFTITPQIELNSTSSEIIDLSPPPPILDHSYKPSKSDEIVGMSPPPPRTSSSKYPLRATQTPRPVLPHRTPPPYRTLPPRTLPPRQSTPRPVRKPLNKDESSTYRPTYEIINKVKRPNYNVDQPSSHLLPPPRELSSQLTLPENTQSHISSFSPTTSVIFPTSLSSSWLTSSNFEFSSKFNFAPSSVYYPEIVSQYQEKPDVISSISLENLDNSYEYESSSESMNVSYENPVTEKKITFVKHMNRTKPLENVTKFYTPYDINFNDDSLLSPDSSQEDSIKNKVKVVPIGNKNRTRKPYHPIRNEDKKISTSKLKIPSKTVSIIKPSRTLSRPEVSYPPRISSIKKIVRPLPSRPLPVLHSSIIESSESTIEDDFIKPTEVLKDLDVSIIAPGITSIIEKTITSTLIISKNTFDSNISPTHHAGNEIKISDDIVPTKTEFKTTVVTLTKTLSEPPQTVSSIGYVNLTHTLTVTHTETSLLSQSEGAVTQTLVLTNTHTSTIVDVVTEIYTQVQPTTIVETVTKHIPIPQVEATNTKIALDDLTMSSEESDNFIIRDNDVTENIQKIEVEEEKDNDTFFVVMNKSQNGGKSPPINTEIETGEYDGVTRNEQVHNNGVSQVLFGEILLAGTPYLETINVARPTVTGYGKECQPDCKASRNERCQRIEGIMKCVCRPGFARMFPDRPCKPTYTYSVSLALGSQGHERLKFQSNLSDNSSNEYHALAVATHEGINRMIMQSDLRDVYHGVHISSFHPVDIKTPKGDLYQGVINDFYVQLSDNAHESRLKEVIEKYLRNNNYSLGGTEVHAADELIDRLNVSDFDECISTQFHDCSEHARCFNLRGTYTCSCLEGFADLSVNTLYPGRICSSDAVGCAACNYHGTCFDREGATICECFKWYAGRTCQVNLKAVLITVTVIGAVVILVVTIWASKRCCCQRGPATQTFVIGCMQGMPSLHQGNLPSKQRADRRALIAERPETETCSVQNTSLPYIPSKQSRSRSTCSKKCVISDPPAHAPPPPPAPHLMIPRARLHPQHSDSRDNLSRKKSSEICSEAKLISYLESGAATNVTEEMRRKHSVESSYSVNKERLNKQGALVSAGFKVSTTVRPDENSIKEDRDDASSVNKTDFEAELSRFDTLRELNSQEDMSEWTDAERRIGELTLSEARSVGGTLPASTGRAASSTRLTHQEANTMAERDLGSTFLLPHVHLYKPDLTSDVSEFDSL